jgi:hypothetical protein
VSYNDDISLKNIVMLDYLKMSAEEGYTQGMFELANEYIKGEICKKNLLKAMVWHRQAARNGFFLSYVCITTKKNLGTLWRYFLFWWRWCKTE